MDHSGAVYYVTPVIEIVRGYGYRVSSQTKEAILHLSKGARIMDHLADLFSDLQTGAYNPILQEARETFGQKGKKTFHFIQKYLSDKYFQQAYEEFSFGEQQLTGRPKEIYKAMAGLATAKYLTQYFLSINHATLGFVPRMIRPFIRSF